MSFARRRFIAAAGALGALSLAPPARAQSRPTIDVKKLGALGDGKFPDLRLIREAIERAADHPAGATVYFPPGEYFLGLADNAYLLNARRLRNVRFAGERATLTCRSVAGSSSMLVLAACQNVTIEGLAFRDHNIDRDSRMGAAAIRLVNDGNSGCENIHIRDCKFESVVSGVVTRHFDDGGRARTRGITLENLSVARSYYGFNFQDCGDDVTGRRLTCNDVNRSYFPYGTSNHDIELDTANNTTGFTDVLIKTYQKDTVGIRAKVKCRGKRGGDAIVALDHQHEKGRGTIRNITLDLDIDDVDCRLDTAILIRSFTPQSRREAQTYNRWDDITLEGDIRICDKTKLIDIATVARVPGRLTLGPRLARNPRLPRSFPGFEVSTAS